MDSLEYTSKDADRKDMKNGVQLQQRCAGPSVRVRSNPGNSCNGEDGDDYDDEAIMVSPSEMRQNTS